MIKSAFRLINYNSSFSDTLTINSVDYLNGTTDYIDVVFWANSYASNLVADSNNTFISGHFVHP